MRREIVSSPIDYRRAYCYDAPMSNRSRGLRAYDLARVARQLSREPMPIDSLSAALDINRATLRNYMRSLRRAGAAFARDDRGRYSLAMSPGEIVALLEAIAAPKTQATSRPCEKSTHPPK